MMNQLMRFLARTVTDIGSGSHTYIVGGAVRNFLLGKPIKDLDVCIDVVNGGRDSGWLADQIKAAIPTRTSLVTNNYGVAILTIAGDWLLDGHNLRGQTIEIANTRTESYGGSAGKGYKPHMVAPATILEDLGRREFTFNTLLWRMVDILEGPETAPVLDLLGTGLTDLRNGVIDTPGDPDRTFGDDPTRMLRAIKFMIRYNFSVSPRVRESIGRCAPGLRSMPWDAVRTLLVNEILNSADPHRALTLLEDLGLNEVLQQMLMEHAGFATAVGRTVNTGTLALRVRSMGWPVRTPWSWLSEAEFRTVQEHVTSMAEPESYLASLVRPALDQQAIFAELELPLAERGRVLATARSLMVRNPTITNLADQVVQELRRHA